MRATPRPSTVQSTSTPGLGKTGRTGPIGMSGDRDDGDGDGKERPEHDRAQQPDEHVDERHGPVRTERAKRRGSVRAATEQPTHELGGDEQDRESGDHAEDAERDRLGLDGALGLGDRLAGCAAATDAGCGDRGHALGLCEHPRPIGGRRPSR